MDYLAAEVLLVDDDLVDRMAFRRSLKMLGIANPIIEASNGIDALEILRAKHTANLLSRGVVVILDLNMPRMSGAEFLEELRLDVPLESIAVFALTSSSMDENLVRASSDLVAGFVNKNKLNHDLLLALPILEHLLAATGSTSPDRPLGA